MSQTPIAPRRAVELAEDATEAPVTTARRAASEPVEAVEQTTLEVDAPRPRRLLTSIGVAALAVGLVGSSVWATTRGADAPEQVQAVVASEAPAAIPSNRTPSVPVPSATASVKPTQRQVSRDQLRPALELTRLTPVRTSTNKATAAKAELKGVRWATAGLKARTAPSKDAELVEVIPEGTRLRVTTTVENGYRQVSWEGARVWVTDDFLTKKEPAEKAEATTRTSSSKTKKPTTTKSTKTESTSETTDSSVSSAPCSRGSGIEAGLTSRADAVYRAVCARFPNVKSYGGLRPGDSGDHGSGRAIDIMISGSGGWDIARWLRANASRFGITQVIFEQQIWTSQRSGDGWRHMSDRGSTTANHYDHVHVAVR